MRPLLALAILLLLDLSACAESAQHKAEIDEMDRRHAWMIETMSGTGGK
jgi:hypothetical protein